MFFGDVFACTIIAKDDALGKRSPDGYRNRVFHWQPVKPPTVSSGNFEKGDDPHKKQQIITRITLEKIGTGDYLSLLNQDDNENVLNLFEKNV